MIKMAGQQGALDGERALWEATIALRRAGADIIITYAAPELVQKI
jgi:porphobilinogen synthase